MNVRKGTWVPAALVATALALSSVSAKPAAADDMDDWKRKVAQLVGKNQGYPRSAQVRRIEGSAQVKVVVDGSGTIASYELVQSTEHAVLDQEVEKLMTKINPLPAPPTPEGITLVLPLTWKLE
ncbi:MAG: energy transducer TonB [Pseudomonadota bacterium]